MELKRLNNIVAIKHPEMGLVGFHSANLEVAELDQNVWNFLESASKETPLSSNNISDAERQSFLALNDWNQEQNAALKSGFIKNKIQNITLNVTQICNLHCSYCAAGGDGTYGDPVRKISIEKTLPQIKFLMDRLSENESFAITFLGGEPLLYPTAIEIIADYMTDLAEPKKVALRFNIVTNGTLVTDEVIRILKKFKMDITVSIDGNKEINDVLRPTKNKTSSTDLAVAGIKKLSAARGEIGGLTLSGVFGKQNLDLMSAYHFYNQFDVDFFDFTYDHQEISPEINAEFVARFSEVMSQAYADGREKQITKIKYVKSYFDLLDNQQKVENFCGAGKNYVSIDAKNNMYVCPWLAGESKEVVGHGDRIWSEKLEEYSQALTEKHGCQDCWAKNLCGGGCMFMHRNKNKDKHLVDENFCVRMKSLLAVIILFYKSSRLPALKEA